MKTKQIIIFLICIVMLGALLRLYQLGNVPNSLNWDEVSWGYNAYSIVKTGMDEYGVKLPLSFQAFGDYKQPIYVYVTAPIVALLGLTSYAVRLPSALFGIVSIILVYLLVKELFKKQKYVDYIGLVASFVFAISPWSIHFSRLAYEANVAIAFVMAGVWMFVKGINNKSWIWLFASIVPLAISSYTYHAEKLFTPLLFAGLLIFGLSFLRKKYLLTALLIVFFVFANSIWLVDMRTTARGRSVTIFSNATPILEESVERIEQDSLKQDSMGVLFHNRRIVFAKEYIDNYLEHFDLNYLFVTGFDVRHHAPAMGLLYLISLPFIIIGIVYLVKNFSRSSALIFYWLLLAPVASSFATNSPNASRALTFLPVWYVFEAFGLYVVYIFLKKKKYFMVAFLAIVLLYATNIFYYTHQYFIHINTDDEWAWQYGYEQAIDYVNENSFDSVVFDDTIEQGYVFYLFHSKYDPSEYILSGGTNNRDECLNIENNFFGTQCLEEIEADILITSKEDAPEDFDIVKDIKYANGETALRIMSRQEVVYDEEKE